MLHSSLNNAMATSEKPVRTGSAHKLPFDKLAPLEFERLCYWLAAREGFSGLQHLGEAGGESGRDVVGWKDGRPWVFQCKRVQVFSRALAKKEIAKLRGLPEGAQPHELVFVVSQTVPDTTRSIIRAEWGDEATCHFWCGDELDEKVKRHPAVLEEFFQLPPERTRSAFPHNLPFASLGRLFQGREEMLALLRQELTEKNAGKATASIRRSATTRSALPSLGRPLSTA